MDATLRAKTRLALSQARLQQLLHYDPETGHFVRRRGKPKGKAAGGNCGQGYVRICVDGFRYKAHRLAWLYVHGDFPPAHLQIDHINRNRSDNRIVNLRVVDAFTNSQNKPRSRNQEADPDHMPGVYRVEKWIAIFKSRGEKRWLGSFKTKKEAVAALQEAIRQHQRAASSP
jgi:hypothetical protein